MPDVINSGNRVKGDHNNFGIINGLNEREVNDVIAKAKDEILKQLSASKIDVMANVAAQSNAAADKLSDIIRSKLCELVGSIDADRQSTAESVRTALQSKLDELSANLSLLTDGVVQDITSLNSALKSEFGKAQDRQNEVLKRLDSRYDWLQQEAEIRYLNIIKQIKSFKTDCSVELLQGNECIKDAKFADAEKFFERASHQDDLRAEAYFGWALAQCKVQLVWDHYYDCAQPILYEYCVKDTFILDNSNYKTALNFATPQQAARFENVALKIKFLLQKFWEYSDNEDSSNNESFGRDCFICVKVSDLKDGSKQTDDCKWVKQSGLYAKLKQRKLRPFFSEIDVPKTAARDPEYESEILYALYKAKCMILVCSDERYLETPYVKNEYSRFLNFVRSKGLDDKQLIIVFNGKKINRRSIGVYNPYDLEDFDRSRFSVDELANWVEARVNKANGCMSAGWLYCPICGKKYRLGSDKCSVAGHGALVDFETYANMLIVRKNAENETLALRLKELPDEINRIADGKRRLEEERKKLADERKAFEKERAKLRQSKGQDADSVSPVQADGEPPESDDKGGLTVVNSEFTVIDGVLISYHGQNSDVVIPDGVRKISDGAFSNYAYGVTIPASVKFVGEQAFKYPEKISRVYICDLSSWCTTNFDGAVFGDSWELYLNGQLVEDLQIPRDAAMVAPYAFSGCSSIERVHIPDTVNVIAPCAFDQCCNLKEVKLSNDLMVIGDMTFRGCGSLERITVPNSVKSIGIEAFHGCTSLIGVTLGSGVREIEDKAFAQCTSLKNVTVLEGVTRIGKDAFYGCRSLESVTVPESVRRIGAYAFGRCSSPLTIHYLGTKLQWQSRARGSLKGLNEYTVFCTNGVIAKR